MSTSRISTSYCSFDSTSSRAFQGVYCTWCSSARISIIFTIFIFQSFHFFMFQLYRSNYRNVTRITHTHNRKKITLENQRSNIGTYVERSVETHESNADCRFGFGGGYGLDGESKKSRCEQIHLQSYHPSWCERI